MAGRLEGKVALITGGTSGIGEATVELFIKEGCQVMIAGRNAEKGAEMVAALGKAAAFVQTDVTREADIKAAIEAATTAFGRLDCLFNNAGGPTRGEPMTVTGDDLPLRHGQPADVGSVVFGIRHAAPIMQAQGAASYSINILLGLVGLEDGLGREAVVGAHRGLGDRQAHPRDQTAAQARPGGQGHLELNGAGLGPGALGDAGDRGGRHGARPVRRDGELAGAPSRSLAASRSASGARSTSGLPASVIDSTSWPGCITSPAWATRASTTPSAGAIRRVQRRSKSAAA